MSDQKPNAHDQTDLNVKALGPTIAERVGSTSPRQQGSRGGSGERFRRDVRDADGDGVVQEGTDFERQAQQEQEPRARRRRKYATRQRTLPAQQAPLRSQQERRSETNRFYSSDTRLAAGGNAPDAETSTVDFSKLTPKQRRAYRRGDLTLQDIINLQSSRRAAPNGKPRRPETPKAEFAKHQIAGFYYADKKFAEIEKSVAKKYGDISVPKNAAKALKKAFPNAVDPFGLSSRKSATTDLNERGKILGLLYGAMLNPRAAKRVTEVVYGGQRLDEHINAANEKSAAICYVTPKGGFGMAFHTDDRGYFDHAKYYAEQAFKYPKSAGFRTAYYDKLYNEAPILAFAAGMYYNGILADQNNPNEGRRQKHRALQLVNAYMALHEFSHGIHYTAMNEDIEEQYTSAYVPFYERALDGLKEQEAEQATDYASSVSDYAKSSVMEAFAESATYEFLAIRTPQVTRPESEAFDRWYEWSGLRTKRAGTMPLGVVALEDGAFALCTHGDGKLGMPSMRSVSQQNDSDNVAAKSAVSIGATVKAERIWVNSATKSGRNSQSVPAKRSERIQGSQQNAARSAASRSAASKITLTPELIAALERKVEEHNKRVSGRTIESSRKASLPMLKAVLRRGMGAFSVSHRPNVSSRQQWGMARVNAFLRLLYSGRPSDPKYISDNDLLPSGHPRASASKKSARLEHTIEHVELETKAAAKRRRIRNVQYNPDARDGDGDGIVQEGTPWERPAGARFLTEAGEEIAKYTSGSSFHPSMRLIDANGEELDYKPIAMPIAGSRRTRRFYAIGAGNQTIGERYEVIGRRPARYQVSTPTRMRNRLAKETIARLEQMFKVGRPKGGKNAAVRGAGQTIGEATERVLRILQAASKRDLELGRGWYAAQREKIAAIADKHGVSIELATGIVAALSPRMAWDASPKKLQGRVITPNLDAADKLIENVAEWREAVVTINARTRRALKIPKAIANGTYAIKDLPVEQQAKFIRIRLEDSIDYNWPFMGKPIANALRIIDSNDVDAGLNGPKVRSFYDNLLNPDTSDAATIDSIMAQLVGQMTAKQAASWLKLKGLGSEGQVRDRNGNLVADAGVYYAIVEIIHSVTERYNVDKAEADRLTVNDVQAILWYIQRERKTRLSDLKKAQKAVISKVKELEKARNAKKPNLERIARLEAEAAQRQLALDDARTVTEVYDSF